MTKVIKTNAKQVTKKTVRKIGDLAAAKEAARKTPQQRALDSLVAWIGTKSALADVAQVSRVAVSRWFSRGVIGKEAALLLSLVKDCPLTFVQMRPDLRKYEFPADVTKAAKTAARDSNTVVRDILRARKAG